MKKMILPALFLLLVNQFAVAQHITYSVVHGGESSRETNIEVLGKVANNFIVFKSVGWRSIIQVFDKDMKELSNDRLKFVPDNLLNADFIAYPNFFIMVYQYQRNAVLYCEAVKMDAKGEMVGEKMSLDTTRIGTRSAKGIYSTVFSEDKSRILVYKMINRNDKLNLVAKSYNNDLQLTDSTRTVIEFNDRKEVYSPFQVTNKGAIVFTKEVKGGSRENINQLELISLEAKTGRFLTTPIDLQGKYIDEVNLKIDNLNNNYIVNTLYYLQKRTSDIEGVFSAIVSMDNAIVKSAANAFSDSLRARVAGSGTLRAAFNDLFLKNIFVKKDGSFIMVAEDFSTETLGGYNRWNRWDYLYNNPYSFYDYNYMYSPYYRYNRFNSFDNRSTTRYYYDDIFILNMDDSLKLTWQNVIMKKQSDTDDDSYLSFGTMNAGGEIHFLFIEREKNTQIISNHSINAAGRSFRYPTLKSREAGYQFMPRLAKQTGARQVIMPCVFRGNIGFAKVDF